MKILANATKICYTYDALGRVTVRTIKKLSDNSVVSAENFTYDAAGNIKTATDSSFQYDTNNRLTVFQGNAVTYDLDGNMTNNGSGGLFSYDSANRLTSAYGYSYRYNAEDVRIRNLRVGEDSKYTYNTNSRLSQLLMKTTGSTITKYVYGRGLIGEETGGVFKTYHFDLRGSTVAITDASGTITDTFTYDTYGKLLSRTGSSNVIFGYNGRDGVVTDQNGLIYMRARYYAPDMKRFVNADVIAGELSNAVTLNRYAYANGNPVSYVDPFGLSAERGSESEKSQFWDWDWQKFFEEYYVGRTTADALINEDMLKAFKEYMKNGVSNAPRPNNIGKGTWAKQIDAELKWLDDVLGAGSILGKSIDGIGILGTLLDINESISQNIKDGADTKRIINDAIIDVGVGVGSGYLAGKGAFLAVAGITTLIGTSLAPGVGTLIGVGVGAGLGVFLYGVTDVMQVNGKSIVDWVKEGIDWLDDRDVTRMEEYLERNLGEFYVPN